MKYNIIINDFDTDSSLMTAIDEAFGKDLSESEIKEIKNNLPYIIWSGDDLLVGKEYLRTICKWRTKAELYDENNCRIKVVENKPMSNVDSVLKGLSVIILIISIIGCFIVFKAQPITGIIMFIVSVLLSALIFGLGEIINILKLIYIKL